MRIEHSIRCLLVAWGFISLAVPVCGVTPLTHYRAICDRVYRPKPAKVPHMGPAGYVYRDPVFKSQTLRVTDENTIRDGQNGSFDTTSASTANQFSCDSRKSFVLVESGGVIPFQFDPATMTARCYTNDLGGRLKPPASRCSALPLSAPEFSYVDPNVIYGIQDKRIVAYNFLKNAVVDVFDVGQAVKAVSRRRLYVGDLGVSSDDNDFVVAYGREPHCAGIAQDEFHTRCCLGGICQAGRRLALPPQIQIMIFRCADGGRWLLVEVAALASEVRKRIEKITALLSSGKSPDLVLIRHCAECEFQSRCRQKAIETHDLSLLAGMSTK